ncbi:enoyl-CoA hydratase family protein [Mycobacterium kansasii]|uniref:enoyl-CoA hydratase family protein n=1 Tax=Mycobacterium kansasii TaxID=1768 RepID=UPI000F01DE13|nr:enoyl-CoA hydratase family protein [Mycobacterium kansasii]VAZ62372.1 Carnitinyl-CoA dehydratase [Mycobacterium kansasii]VAZ68809.1 Carnitinyl-CoA dehydratase [Mycobacterium kansasii]
MDALVEYAGPDECGGPLARLTLNSPHNRNALSSVLVSQLHQGLRDAAADPAVRVVVLTHTGGTFCAGADLSEAGGGDPRGDRERGAAGRSGSPPSAGGDRERGAAGRSGSPPSAGGDRERGAAGRSGSPPSAYDMAVARAREMTTVLRAIVESPRPVIGAVNGHVRAGGFGLVGACDIVVAGPRSTFALTEARIGVAPAIISLTLLPKLSPRAAARYYLTGETFGASEAAEIGLVTMAADDVDAAVAKLVAEVGRGSPQGLAASKALTTPAVLEGFDRDAQRLAEESARLFVSEEAREGMLAFLQKRPPSWVKADPASR